MIVGRQLATHLRTEFVMDARAMANALRRPREDYLPPRWNVKDGGASDPNAPAPDSVSSIRVGAGSVPLAASRCQIECESLQEIALCRDSLSLSLDSGELSSEPSESSHCSLTTRDVDAALCSTELTSSCAAQDHHETTAGEGLTPAGIGSSQSRARCPVGRASGASRRVHHVHLVVTKAAIAAHRAPTTTVNP